MPSAALAAKNKLWSRAERRAWKLPERLTVSEWADKYRILDPVNTPGLSGPWATARTPYLRGIMDALIDPYISEITIMSCAQIGKTEAMLNMLAYIVDQDPGPVLWVLPRDEDVRRFSKGRLQRMLLECPRLRKHLTHKVGDMARRVIRLERMVIYLGSANSPASLAGMPIRYVFLDEVDKFPKFSGTEADPVKLSLERTATVWNRKIIKVSTPTTRYGFIAREYEASDERLYYVPCPHCGEMQVLALEQIGRPADCHDPDQIEKGHLAWYECVKCKAHWTDQERIAALPKGEWRQGKPQRTHHAGFASLSRLYSPWPTHSLSAILAEFWRSSDHPELLMNFRNSWLGAIWEEQIQASEAKTLKQRCEDYPRGKIAPETHAITMGVDVQQSALYYVIAAWGNRMESWRLDWGVVNDFGQIQEMLGRRYAIGEDRSMGIALANVDSGFRTDEVYQWCRLMSPVTRPTKGHDVLKAPYLPGRVDYQKPGLTGMAGGLMLWHVWVDYYKDYLWRLINLERSEPGYWHLHKDVSDDYLRQVCSEHKIVKRDRLGRAIQVWETKTAGMANHFLDCEVLALAAADMLGVGGHIPPPPVDSQKRERQPKAWLGETKEWL